MKQLTQMVQKNTFEQTVILSGVSLMLEQLLHLLKQVSKKEQNNRKIDEDQQTVK